MIQFIYTESKCIYTFLFLERQEDFNKQVMLYINGRFVSKTINKKKNITVYQKLLSKFKLLYICLNSHFMDNSLE